MERKAMAAEFHAQVVKPVARFLREYPGDLNEALALRLCLTMALAHEKRRDPESRELDEFMRAVYGTGGA